MRIAFYAPLKPPDHPTPSGDRRVARLLIEALESGGHKVELACRFRSREGRGDEERQQRLAALGATLAGRLIARYRRRPPGERPEAWLTYHLYYKAPDHLGPRVADALAIPYLVAEASHAQKRAAGSYAAGHAAAAAAIRRADAILILNPADAEGLGRIADPARCHRLRPFLDAHRPTPPHRDEARGDLARALSLPEDAPWILAVAMMRAPDKLASYRLLAEAAGRILHRPWRLILIGEGPERPAVEAAFAPVRERVRFAGLRRPEDIARFHAACDLFAWPAINEAWGMAILEAAGAGLPVVAGRTGGVPEIVAHGETGLLAAPGDAAGFASALERLLEAPELRLRYGQAAARRVAERHGFTAAVQRLNAILKDVATR
jgi:glycosyltransferase involved in cell wall biosynthesis